MASFKTIFTAFAITSINTMFLLPYSINAARFDIINKCSYTVWAAAVPGGGRKLDRGQSWPLDVNAGTVSRIWARTNCKFKGDSGHCETGDCGGLLECRAHGTPPNTFAEYALNQYNNQDILDLSVVEGFNVPMEFSPTSGQCSKGIKCTADINGQCPSQLRTSGGCNNPCTVLKTNEFCCTRGPGTCGPTTFFRFFNYPQDEQTRSFICPGGTNYKVVFCP